MGGDSETTVSELKDLARRFTNERDWEQFHHPKDLAMAIAIEAGELMEPFLWKDGDIGSLRDDPVAMKMVEEELADVLILAMCMANTLELDVSGAYRRKMESNAVKYPVERSRGKADKYDRL